MPAPQIQGTPTTAQQDTAVTSFSINKPSGAVVDEYLFCFVRFNIQTTVFSDTQGFTQAIRNNAANANAQYIFYKKVDGTEPTSFTFVHGSSTVHAMMVRVSNVHLSTPIDDSQGVTQVATVDNIDLPSLTTTGPNRLLFWAASNLSATSVDWTPDLLDTNELVDSQPAANSAWAVTREPQVAAGASGTRNAAWGSTGSGQNGVCCAVIPADDSTPEALVPVAGGAVTNLSTYDATVIDDDPDAAGTDFLTGTDPSGTSSTTSYFYADAQDGTTPAGFAGQLTTPANAVGSSEASQSATVSPTQNSDFGTNFSFDETAIASAIPSTATVDSVEVDLRQWVSSAARGTVGIRLDSAAGTQIATEKTLTSLITAAPTTGTPGTNNTFGETGDAWSTVPTRAQLVAAAFRARVRARRTASQAWTYTLDWVRMRADYTAVGSTVNTEVRAPMSDPVDTLVTGAASGEIRVQVRKLGSGTDPTVVVTVRNAAGTNLATAVASTAVTATGTAGQVVSGTFDQSVISNKTDVVVWVTGTGAVGGLVEVGAVRWYAKTAVVAQLPVRRQIVSRAGSVRANRY